MSPLWASVQKSPPLMARNGWNGSLAWGGTGWTGRNHVRFPGKTAVFTDNKVWSKCKHAYPFANLGHVRVVGRFDARFVS